MFRTEILEQKMFWTNVVLNFFCLKNCHLEQMSLLVLVTLIVTSVFCLKQKSSFKQKLFKSSGTNVVAPTGKINHDYLENWNPIVLIPIITKVKPEI